MAASEIRLSPDQMVERANSYETSKAQLEAARQVISGIKGNLETEWSGTSQQRYLPRVEEMLKSLARSVEFIDEISAELKRVAQSFADVDSSVG